jgi:hypothetical protein
MFSNFKAKIEGYQATFGFDNDFKTRMWLICDIYIELYQKIEQIRATMSEVTAFQDTILNGEPRGDVAPPTPVFTTITMPPDSFIGILDEFRENVAFLKANPNYTESIGLDLMIVAEDSNGNGLTESSPDLKLAAKNDTQVEIAFKKLEADAIEIQYRKVGTETWLLADKATNSPIVHSPQFTTPGQAEKFEYRAIFLVKNERIGVWSPIYTITVG